MVRMAERFFKHESARWSGGIEATSAVILSEHRPFQGFFFRVGSTAARSPSRKEGSQNQEGRTR